jgi:hypothetical protein
MNALIRGRSTLLLLAVLLAAGLRFYRIEAQSFWRRGNAVGLARRDVNASSPAPAAYPSAGLLPAARKLDACWASAASAYRSLSAVASVALVAVVYGLGAHVRPRAGCCRAAPRPARSDLPGQGGMYALLALVAAEYTRPAALDRGWPRQID